MAGSPDHWLRQWPGGAGPLNSNSMICLISISLNLFFFKSILSRKDWRGEGEWLLKIGTIEWWLRFLTMLLPGPDLLCASPWNLGDFLRHLLA